MATAHVETRDFIGHKRAHHTWIAVGDRNTKFFQVTAILLGKDRIIFQKIMDKNRI